MLFLSLVHNFELKSPIRIEKMTENYGYWKGRHQNWYKIVLTHQDINFAT